MDSGRHQISVPALSCAGHSMAAHLGCGILHSAGLPDGVVDSPQALHERVLQPAADPAALPAWRERPGAEPATAPLFHAAAKVRESERAWATMVGRYQDGLAPYAFDVPDHTLAVERLRP